MDKAYKLLLDQEQKKRALDVIQAGKEYVEHTVSIYSAAVFTGSISKPWAPCRRVNVNIAIPTGVIRDLLPGLRKFAVVLMNSVCPRAQDVQWLGGCSSLFPYQPHAVERGPLLPSHHLLSHYPILRVEEWSSHDDP